MNVTSFDHEYHSHSSSATASSILGGMELSFSLDGGLLPICFCVEKVFAVCSRSSDWLYVTFLRPRCPLPGISLIFSSGFQSTAPPLVLVHLFPPPVVSSTHGAQEEAVPPGAFHPAIPPNLGYQQVEVPFRYRTEPAACRHQQPHDPNHHHHHRSKRFAPVGSILSSTLLLRLNRQCSLP